MINQVLLCNQKRVEELNNKIYKRNLTSAKIDMHESFRSVPTRQVHFPILDCNKPNKVKKLDNEYNVNTMFTPATHLPTQSYRDNIDVETKLRGAIFPLQKCDKANFIPSSSSDLYSNNHLPQKSILLNNPHQMLFHSETFDKFNPNKCNLGYKLFNNNTRVQLRDL